MSDEYKAFRPAGMGYIYEPKDMGVSFLVDQLQKEKGDWRGRITVSSTLPGMGGHILRSRHLLEGARTIPDLVKALSEISGEHNPLTKEWAGMLRTLLVSVVNAEEAGQPFIKVGQLAREVARVDRVEQLLPEQKITLLYGPGGSGKGYIATRLAVAVQTGTEFCGLKVQQGEVLYLDWEDDDVILNERLQKVCKGLGMDPVSIHYRACKGRLDAQISEIAAYVATHRIALVIVDSFQPAAGTVSEHGTYEDVAMRLMSAVRLLNTTVLVIDHVNNDGRKGDGLAGKAYGSVFKGYLARCTWEIKKDQDTGSNVSQVGLYQTKTNHTALLPPIGLVLDFSDPEAVTFSRCDVRDSATLAAGASMSYRLADVLVKNPGLTAKQLAELLEAKEDSVRVELNRGARAGKYVSLGLDGAKGHGWYLVDRSETAREVDGELFE